MFLQLELLGRGTPDLHRVGTPRVSRGVGVVHPGGGSSLFFGGGGKGFFSRPRKGCGLFFWGEKGVGLYWGGTGPLFWAPDGRPRDGGPPEEGLGVFLQIWGGGRAMAVS